jgi:hypothetical protein
MSTLRSVQHYQSLNLSSPRVTFSSGNRRSFQHLRHPRQLRLVSICHRQRLVASSSCLLVIKVCCPSHTVVWEGSVWGALVRCPVTGRLPSDRTCTSVVTGSVLGFPSASLLVVSQLECPVSFFGAASSSAPPYKANPGHLRHCPFWSPFTTCGSVRGWVF